VTSLSIAEMVYIWIVFFGSSSLSFCDENAVMTRFGLLVGGCAHSTVSLFYQSHSRETIPVCVPFVNVRKNSETNR
jgi:hypothetical protein